MAIISRITTQKKNKQRYNIYFDEGQGEKFGFGIDEDILIKYHIKKGMKLEHSVRQQILNEETFHQSYVMAIRYLSYRMRTKQEIENYLLKKEVEPEQIPRVIDKLEKENLLDDEAFSKSFVRNRINMSQKGPLLVKQELTSKGVSNRIAAQAIEQYTYERQYNIAMKWAEKRVEQKKKNAFKKRLQSIKASLAQKGFAEDVIRDVVADLVVKDKDVEEWEAVLYHGKKILQRHEKKLDGYELKNKVKEGLYRQGFALNIINKFLDKVIE
ncbi:recombination regulator RecX [Virgibacillus sp. W0181]|uniref:recombination regulator RecX n=1 Tax=Virgibacillus sp. W0181 TaxID=3391581 RepID=UPI003F450C51